jgi:hypothetical protein
MGDEGSGREGETEKCLLVRVADHLSKKWLNLGTILFGVGSRP